MIRYSCWAFNTNRGFTSVACLLPPIVQGTRIPSRWERTSEASGPTSKPGRKAGSGRIINVSQNGELIIGQAQVRHHTRS